MSLLIQELQRFLEELRDRKVYRVATAYAAFAFIVVQVADLVLPAFDSSGSAYRIVVILALLGFPVAVVLAWVFEWTPDGVRVTSSTARVESSGSRTQIARELLIALAAVGVAIGASWYLAGTTTLTTIDQDRSIAVLPFEYVDTEEPGSLVNGLHDDLLTRLSAIHGFSVIARSSVERYRGSDRTSAEIAAELGVRWILEGTVQRIGEQARVSARLVDPIPGVQAWADSYLYDMSAKNLFAVQSEITHKIANALQMELTPAEEVTINARPTENLDAYRLLIEARTLLKQREEPQMRRALALFRQATELDPEFALAWVGVADSLYELVDYGFNVPDDAVDQAMQAAERALQLEPENPEAFVSLGIILHLRQDGLGAIRRIEQAIELRPSYAEAFSKISWVGQILGRPRLAFETAEKAIELDPLAVESRANFAMTQLFQGDAQRALATLKSESELLQEWPTTRFYEGVVLYHMGRHTEAIEVLNGLSVAWAGEGPLATKALAYAASGDLQTAASILSQLKASDAHAFLVGLVHASLGDRETAFAEFKKIENWTTDVDWPILSARYLFPEILDPLRADPRYDRMLRQIDHAWGMVM
jgi:TolB-like protein